MPTAVYCTKCELACLETDDACAACGHRLAAQPDARTPASHASTQLPQPLPDTMLLEEIAGTLKGLRFTADAVLKRIEEPVQVKLVHRIDVGFFLAAGFLLFAFCFAVAVAFLLALLSAGGFYAFRY